MIQQNAGQGRGEWQGQLRAFGAEATPATLAIQYRPPAERMLRTAGSLVGCLAAAAVMAFVPPHIPWILGWTGFGFYLAARWAREDVSLLGVRGTCPRCKVAVTLKPGGRAAEERKVHCPECREQLTLTTGRAAVADA